MRKAEKIAILLLAIFMNLLLLGQVFRAWIPNEDIARRIDMTCVVGMFMLILTGFTVLGYFAYTRENKDLK